jgi:hypothetical protein
VRGHQDLAGGGGGHDPSGDVDRDPAHIVAAQVDLAGVEPGSDLDSARSQLRPQRQGAADAPTGPVEDGQHAVAGALDQPPTLLVD